MGLELSQHLKLAQQLVMTPQLQQAVKLLQFSRVELVEAVQREFEENPFLEEVTEEGAGEGEAPEERRSEGEEPEAVYAREVARDAAWEDYLGEFSSAPRDMREEDRGNAEELTPFEGRYAQRPSLEGHLLWQLRLSSLTERQKELGEAIIHNLSPTGYLQATVAELAALTGASEEELEEVLGQVQQSDPPGVAARDVRECLLIQLRVLGYDSDPVVMELVGEHLGDLEAHNYKPLLKKFSLEPEELQARLEIIQQLEPMPGASFGGGQSIHISPDVFVYKQGGDFVIVLNDEGLPRIQLSSLYTAGLDGLCGSQKEYCQQKRQAASWLLKSLYQRQRTLYKVVESIVRHQRGFFEQGIAHLVPLVLRDIAEDTGMHESTVSRATTNKYVATPFGTFELKFFFNSALSRDGGGELGSESVKAAIRQLVHAEDSRHPLSDERISELLKEQLKINVARRTVAKYRNALGIAPASRRRKILP